MDKTKIKLYVKRGLLAFILLNVLLMIIALFIPLTKESKIDNVYDVTKELLNYDKTRKVEIVDIENINYVEKTYDNNYGKKVIDWQNNDSITFTVNVETKGEYELAIDYISKQENIIVPSIDLFVNDKEVEKNIAISSNWTDETKDVIYDIYRNEIVPVQTNLNIWRHSFLYDQMFYNSSPISFKLNQGINKITLNKTEGHIVLGNVYLFKKEALKDYKAPSNNNTAEKEIITLEAEKPLFKSHPEIRPKSEQNVSMTPYSTKFNRLNTISGDSFNKSGYSVTYAFKVEKPGNYNISLKYYISQTNTNVYNRILIDNVVLNKNLNSYKFKELGGFNNETLNVDGNNMEFYFDGGIHTITFQLDASNQAPIYYELNNIIDEINELYLEIIKLTGGKPDSNKHYDIEKYIPTADDRLFDWKTRLESMLELINEISKTNSKKQNRLYQNISNAYDKLLSLCDDPNQLPHKLGLLQDSSSSIANMLSTSIHTSTFSPMSIDKIYIHGSNAKLPKAKSNFFMSYFSTIQRIFKSGVEKSSKDELKIWVNRSTYYVSLMQQYADAYFTPKTGIKVRFSLLPDESKIIYANASKTNPDLALGVSPNVPYEMGIRGALVDLSKLDGFEKLAGEFAKGAYSNMVECDKVYGLPETCDFNVTFYRKDILEKFKLEVPNTYEEIIKILPELQRYGMNYYMPLAGGSGLKSISATAPFIYQYGGDIYSEDYLKTAIDEPEAIKALNMMVELFSIYSLPLTSQNFYDSFRHGTIPVGVSGFESYLQLMTAAPEIRGEWDITLAPGVKDKNGEINRTNTGVSKGAIIFENSKKHKESWEFMKWWLSSETQANFANDIEASYGETFLWNSANLDAFAKASLPKEHKKVILEQWKYLYNVPQTPATYIIERGISDAWNQAVFDQKPLRAVVSDAVITINKEITRKMIEFKYIDEKNNVLKEYYIPRLEDVIIRKETTYGKDDEE